MAADTLGKVKADLLAAIKSGDQSKADALRFILSAVQNAAIAKGKDASLTVEELLEVLQKQAKQRRESIAAYEKGGRADLAGKEKEELVLIEAYLPRMLTEEEIRPLVEKAIGEADARGQQDMGKVMGLLMPRVKGKVDGAVVSKIVKELLSS
jgi:uncharacterized protein YqeY